MGSKVQSFTRNATIKAGLSPSLRQIKIRFLEDSLQLTGTNAKIIKLTTYPIFFQLTTKVNIQFRTPWLMLFIPTPIMVLPLEMATIYMFQTIQIKIWIAMSETGMLLIFQREQMEITLFSPTGNLTFRQPKLKSILSLRVFDI